jgi:hypothetical protein
VLTQALHLSAVPAVAPPAGTPAITASNSCDVVQHGFYVKGACHMGQCDLVAITVLTETGFDASQSMQIRLQIPFYLESSFS